MELNPLGLLGRLYRGFGYIPDAVKGGFCLIFRLHSVGAKDDFTINKLVYQILVHIDELSLNIKHM